jgi:hypothetical protein
LVDSPQEIAQHTATTKPTFPMLFDGGAGFSLKMVDIAGKRTAFVLNPAREAILEVPGFPTTYIVDCSGLTVGYSVGVARWDDGSAQAFIQSLVGDRRHCAPARLSLLDHPAQAGQ